MLVVYAGAIADDLNEPPPPPLRPFPSDVKTPNGISAPSPQGETPYDPSKPTSDYAPQPAPTVSITGGVNVPVSGDCLRIDAKSWRVDFEDSSASIVTATGDVKARYKEFTVTSDNATADLRSKVASFTGHVALTVNRQEVRGECLTIHLDTRVWSFLSARSTVEPECFPGKLLAPVFLTGSSISGVGDRVIDVEGGEFTTCDLDHPHYLFNAKSTTIWPDRKLIARDATFIAVGRTIIKLSRLAIPLRDILDRPTLVPRVGHTEEEGYYMKAAYPYSATRQNSGSLGLDLMSRKGVGVAVIDNYALQNASGNLYLYQLSDQNSHLSTLTGRFTHLQKIGSVTAGFTSDYRAQSYEYSPQSTSVANELRLNRQKCGAITSWSLRDATDIGFGRYDRLTSNLNHSQQLTKNSSMTLSLDYFRSTNPVTINTLTLNSESSQLNTNLAYRNQQRRFDWALNYAEITDLSNEVFISQSGQRFAGTERLPELELNSSGQRLGWTFLGLPTALGLAVGRYREDLGRVEEDRALASVELPPKTFSLAKKLDLTGSGGFRQYVYSDDTAQYCVNAAANLTRRFGQRSSAALDYRYLRPEGFTPFRFDFVGEYNALTGSYNLQETEKLKLSMFTGYNFDQPDFQWQDWTLRASYAPSQRFLFYTSTAYDLNRSKWRALVNQFRFRFDPCFRLDLGSRYDLTEQKFDTVKAVLDTPVGKLWHLRANAAYNGFTSLFDYRNLQIVRDLHCWEMSLTYVDQRGFYTERGLRLNFRIKAFPIFDRFGVGQFGQTLDTSVGEGL